LHNTLNSVNVELIIAILPGLKQKRGILELMANQYLGTETYNAIDLLKVASKASQHFEGRNCKF
jgi:hypothetical protein